MKLNFSHQRVLAIVAHPDDAELLCAGTLARAKADGAAIGVCVLCRGDKGQPDPPIENLADVRRAEMTAAAQLLGAELLEGGFGDGELYDAPDTRARLMELVRQFQATLLIAHAPSDYHPDHTAASVVTQAVSWFCASAAQKTVSPPLPAPPAVWFMDTVNMVDFSPDFFINVGEHLELKRQMMRCHQSQLARAGLSSFTPLEDLMVRQCQARGAQSGVAAAEAFAICRAWKRDRAW